ncbi:MAG: polymorphic toxin type 17 domain-containing protein [Pseudonocardiaceae bacterium]
MKHVADPAPERAAERRSAFHAPSTEPAPTAPAQREVAESAAKSTRPLSARSALLLQRQAGNRATARLMAQRQKTTPPASGDRGTTPTGQSTTGQSTTDQSAAAGPALAAVDDLTVQRLVPGRGGPGQDPKFTALKRDVKSKQQTVGKHPPAAAEAKAAQGAAKPPQDDKEAQGKAANAEKMNAAKPGEFDKAAFIKAVNDAIAKQAPKNLDEADNFGDSGKADAVKGEVQGKVGQGKQTSAKAIETTTKAPPDTAAAKDKPVTPLRPDQPPPKPGAPNPEQAVPDKAPPAATDFSDGPKQVDQQMADAKVTEDQLAKSNEPEFTGALKEKTAGEAHAATAPGQVRAAETKTLAGAKAQAAQAGAASMTTMTADRAKAGKDVAAGKEGAKGDDESKRAQVTATLQKVFDATKKDVEDILNGLDKKVDEKFSSGEKAARDAFTADYTQKIDKYKDDRYSGLIGKGRWIKDQFAGLPSEVNVFYEQARKGYVDRMQGVISSVADVIGAELTRAKQRIATGRTELAAEVKKLPTDLQAIGKEAAGEFEGKFDELTQSVNDKGTELVDTLASKYTEALKAVDEEIDAEKEKNKGLIAKAIDAVKGVIDTILKLKDLLLSVLAKAAQAVMAIIKDPIGFLGKLVSAVGAGLKAFMANIANHLQKGLVSWLLGAAAKAGLQLPAKFDLKGILMLIASLLGLTWAAIRGRIVSKGVPEQAMGAVESSVPLAQKLQSPEGIGGIWEDIKEKVGDLKENLLGKITEYLIPTVIVAGITWIISLLNPASAFIKACKAIVDIVSFIIDRGAQIAAFVNAVLDAVIAIAGGGAGGVPGLIQTALATALPVLIGFLAALLGIGGLAEKVKKFFQALSKPVMKAVDWVVNKIVTFGKKIWAKIKGKLGKGKEDPEHARKVAAGLAAIDQEEQAYLKDGKIARADAEKIARTVRSQHGVFKSINVVDGGETWDYDYVASPGKKKKGEEKEVASKKAALKNAQLPTSGRIRYVPPGNWTPNQPLPRGPQNGYIDKFGNEWVRGSSRTAGEAFEWDVQLSSQGKSQLGWLAADEKKSHANVSLGGEVTHAPAATKRGKSRK